MQYMFAQGIFRIPPACQPTTKVGIALGYFDSDHSPAYSLQVLKAERLGQSKRFQLISIEAEVALCKPHNVTHHYLLLDSHFSSTKILPCYSHRSDDHCPSSLESMQTSKM